MRNQKSYRLAQIWKLVTIQNVKGTTDGNADFTIGVQCWRFFLNRCDNFGGRIRMPCVNRLQAYCCEPLKTAPCRLQDDIYKILDLSLNHVKFQDLLDDLRIHI